MSIHYQSTVELARSELLDTPLKDAIGAINIPRLEELTALWVLLKHGSEWHHIFRCERAGFL